MPTIHVDVHDQNGELIHLMGCQTAPPMAEDEDGNEIAPAGFEDIEAGEPLAAASASLEGSWAVRSCPSSKGPGALVVLRSLTWPGAVTVGVGRRFCNVYVGNGLPFVGESYSPPTLPDVREEYAPVEDELPLVEQEDTLADPTPPVEEEPEDEDD